MKKLFLLVLSMSVFSVFAQNSISIKEDFSSNRLQWDEFFEKDCSGYLKEGFFILQSKKEEGFARSVADIPIDINKNFKLTFKFLIPKVNDDYYFGIVFDYEDENNYCCFLVSEKKFKICNVKDGTMNLSRQGSIILASGKNKNVDIVMKKQSGKLTFEVDNMEVITVSRQITYNTFGFQVENNNEIQVDELTVEQKE